jgi:hypothetical protein
MVVGAPQSLLAMPGMEMVIGEELGDVAQKSTPSTPERAKIDPFVLL